MLTLIEDFIDKFNQFGMKIFYFNVNIFNEIRFPMIISLALFGCIYFMFKLRFVCFSRFFHACKLLLNGGGHGGSSNEKQNISSFRALFTSIAGAAGLGNLSGVVIGISIGGPGVVLWILIAAVLFMPLRFAEVYLGHKYRFQDKDGAYQGGPYYYMVNGLKNLGLPKLGIIFASIYSVLLIISTYGGACSFQSNQAVSSIVHGLNLPQYSKYIASGIIASIVFFVTIGGVKRVAEYCSSAVMIFMSLYVIVSFIVIIYYHEYIPFAFNVITEYAFNKSSAFGGAIAVFLIAFQRLELANETGFGTAPSIHCSSHEQNSVKEALISMICPVIDAIFVCFVTGVIVCVSKSAFKPNLEGIAVLQDALQSVHPILGYFLTISIPIVAINVMIAWCYYGVKNLEFISKTKRYSVLYMISFCLFAFFGGIVNNFKIIVDFCNVVNFAILIPNIVAVVLLRKEISAALNEYILQIRYNKNEKNK